MLRLRAAVDALQFLGLVGEVFEVLEDDAAGLAQEFGLGEVVLVLQGGHRAGVEVDGEVVLARGGAAGGVALEASAVLALHLGHHRLPPNEAELELVGAHTAQSAGGVVEVGAVEEGAEESLGVLLLAGHEAAGFGEGGGCAVGGELLYLVAHVGVVRQPALCAVVLLPREAVEQGRGSAQGDWGEAGQWQAEQPAGSEPVEPPAAPVAPEALVGEDPERGEVVEPFQVLVDEGAELPDGEGEGRGGGTVAVARW